MEQLFEQLHQSPTQKVHFAPIPLAQVRLEAWRRRASPQREVAIRNVL
ncbi:MAG TPA: hypothetical protein VFB50_17875 [Chloroflexota bacterium]|nr:hypothetical protein [Chloroflexota bacterium]